MRIFDGTNSSLVHFARHGTDKALGVIRGRFSFSTEELLEIFNPTVDKIVEGCLQWIEKERVPYLILCGGLADQPYLRKRLKDALEPMGTELIIPDEPWWVFLSFTIRMISLSCRFPTLVPCNYPFNLILRKYVVTDCPKRQIFVRLLL
jgi:hypothetical protein